MPTCEDCDELLGEPASIPPHAWLVAREVKKRADGVMEKFKCLTCGARWERLSGSASAVTILQVWRML